MRYFLLILITGIVFCSCSSNSEKINELSQLNNKRICILTGSAADLASRAAFPNAVFLDMAGSADAALAVKTGKADAFIHEKSMLLKIIAKNPDLTLLDEKISELEIAAAVNKNNAALLLELNAALNDLKSGGVIDTLRMKWIDSDYISTPPMREFEYDAGTGSLKMGTCAIYEPYAFISDGYYTGIDIELSRLIGRFLNKKIEIADMAFESLIPALQSGKIDFALANFTITEERKKFIAYTIPYIKNDISVLVKK